MQGEGGSVGYYIIVFFGGGEGGAVEVCLVGDMTEGTDPEGGRLQTHLATPPTTTCTSPTQMAVVKYLLTAHLILDQGLGGCSSMDTHRHSTTTHTHTPLPHSTHASQSPPKQ
jgi:hypothetical protein